YVADALPIGMRHESGKRRESADAQHHDVALFTRRDAHSAQGACALAFCCLAFALDRERLQALAAVRRYKMSHRIRLVSVTAVYATARRWVCPKELLMRR